MAKKKNISKEDIITMYIDYVLEHNEDPKTVYKFCKDNNFNEALFYVNFASFQTVKSSIFTAFFNNAITLLDESEEYKNFDARNQLLSFYFTFFEVLTANRSYVVYALKEQKNTLKGLKNLQGLRTHFKNYIDDLDVETLDIKQEKLEKLQQTVISESAWVQLLVTLKFWLDDTSVSFEKTDVFIEKSVNASFDVLNIAPLRSVIDLGKFLFKEKMV